VGVGELETRSFPTTSQEFYDERRVEVQQIVDIMKKVVVEYDTLLVKFVHTWTTLSEDPERVKVQAQMDEVQRQQELLKQAMKIMSPIEKMQKDRDKKILNKQFNSLNEKEESLATRLEPLKEVSTILAQVV